LRGILFDIFFGISTGIVSDILSHM